MLRYEPNSTIMKIKYAEKRKLDGLKEQERQLNYIRKKKQLEQEQ